MNELEKAISYCKGRIKSLNKAQNQLPFQKFDQMKHDNITKKIRRYEFILQALMQKQQKDEIINAYAEAARVIALYLKEFCDTSLPYDKMIADAARKAGEKLERRQWIPVSKGLPKPNTESINSSPFLVTVKGAKKATILWFAWSEGTMPTWHDACNYTYEVMAWRPLPEVWKEESSHKAGLLDKRICDAEPGATSTETYREFLSESVEEFGGYLDFDNMTDADVKKYVEHYNYLWGK